VRPGAEQLSSRPARKLSFKEQRELESLPQRIETLEGEQTQLHQKIADPAFYRQAGSEIGKATDRLAELEHELQAAYARWQELDSRQD
jgi:ATP-binding cassette subfamily F protein uup